MFKNSRTEITRSKKGQRY